MFKLYLPQRPFKGRGGDGIALRLKKKGPGLSPRAELQHLIEGSSSYFATETAITLEATTALVPSCWVFRSWTVVR